MGEKVVCPRCEKEVERLCSLCWRCKECVLDCNEHMKRTIDGHIEGFKKVKIRK